MPTLGLGIFQPLRNWFILTQKNMIQWYKIIRDASWCFAISIHYLKSSSAPYSSQICHCNLSVINSLYLFPSVCHLFFCRDVIHLLRLSAVNCSIGELASTSRSTRRCAWELGQRTSSGEVLFHVRFKWSLEFGWNQKLRCLEIPTPDCFIAEPVIRQFHLIK